MEDCLNLHWSNVGLQLGHWRVGLSHQSSGQINHSLSAWLPFRRRLSLQALWAVPTVQVTSPSFEQRAFCRVWSSYAPADLIWRGNILLDEIRQEWCPTTSLRGFLKSVSASRKTIARLNFTTPRNREPKSSSGVRNVTPSDASQRKGKCCRKSTFCRRPHLALHFLKASF